MTDVTPYVALSSLTGGRTQKRQNLVVTGAIVLVAAIFAGYSGITALYASQRADVLAAGETWLPNGVSIPLTQPNYMGLSIIFAFVTMWWAASAARNSDRSNLLLSLGMTMLFGFGFVVQAFYLFEIMDMPAAESLQAVLIYSMAGLHLLLVLAGLFAVIVTFIRAIVGDFVEGRSEAVKALAVYWTGVALVYAQLWYAVYITK